MPTAFAVLAIPETGIFVKDGRIVTGHGTEMEADEIILFKRRADAVLHSRSRTNQWIAGDANGKKWSFPIVAVLIRERV
jgi:hypothetical protein